MSSAGEASAATVLTETLDGATGDYGVSGDAMRWSPELAADPDRSAVHPLPGVAAAGLGGLLGLDGGGMWRLVTGALSSLTGAASDVVSELRQLTRGT
jgi:hypothetical protein